VLALVAWQPASAQTIDSAQVTFLQAQTIQYLRFQDKRGINVFETSKSPGAAYSGFKLAWGAAFTQSFQALDHSNTADSVETSPANQVNRNRLMPIGAGFNTAMANMYMHAQLAPGIRVQLTTYLSTRHHNETWVKDGFLQVDESPIDLPLFHDIMKYTTLKVGHFEVNYGDMHFRRSDGGQALYNPFVESSIMDAFTTEIGTEAIIQRNGLLAVFALTNGEIRGNITRPDDRAPAVMVKLGMDRQMNEDLRVRLTGSYRSQSSAISNTLFGGDRAGSHYYFVTENTAATEAANSNSGRVNPGFRDNVSTWVINPFIKFRGAEFFGMYEVAEGKASNETVDREVTQLLGEMVYRFGAGEKLFVGARWNSLTGDLGTAAPDADITRTAFGGGWFVTPSLLLKAEFVNQTYDGFVSTDIRNGAKFSGFVIQAVTAF
jgi:hypothetical protein